MDILHRVASLHRSRVYHMKEHLRPLDVAQEFVAKAGAIRSAFDQPGNIRHHKAVSVAQVHNAQVRV